MGFARFPLGLEAAYRQHIFSVANVPWNRGVQSLFFQLPLWNFRFLSLSDETECGRVSICERFVEAANMLTWVSFSCEGSDRWFGWGWYLEPKIIWLEYLKGRAEQN